MPLSSLLLLQRPASVDNTLLRCCCSPALAVHSLALQSLVGEGQRGLAAPLVDVLFGRRSPRCVSSPPAWQPLNPGLDESQQRAVSLALAAQDVALIHGGWAGEEAGRLYAGVHASADGENVLKKVFTRLGWKGAIWSAIRPGERRHWCPSCRAPWHRQDHRNH
jgi:hypothetical protein